MQLDYHNTVLNIQKNSVLNCDADCFVDDTINLLEALDSEYVDNEMMLYQYDDSEDDENDDQNDGFVDIPNLIKRIKQGDNLEAKALVELMENQQENMTDVIFGAFVLLNEGEKTMGRFNADPDNAKQRFDNACKIIRDLDISVIAQDQLIISLAGRSSIINLIKSELHPNMSDNWQRDASTIFNFKLKRLCNYDFSPVLKVAKENANEKLYQYNRKKLYQELKETNLSR